MLPFFTGCQIERVYVGYQCPDFTYAALANCQHVSEGVLLVPTISLFNTLKVRLARANVLQETFLI